MKHTGRLKIIVETHGTQVKRRFDPSFETETIFGEGLHYLLKKKRQITRAFPGIGRIINKILSKEFNLFTESQDMPWYLDLIAQRIIDKPGSYNIYVKACKEYTFFDVSVRKAEDEPRQLLLSPFFHKTPLPESADDEELVRGLADTFLFLSPLLKEVFEEAARDKSKQGEVANMIKDAVEWFTIVLNTEEIKPLGEAKLSTNQYELSVQSTVCWNYSSIAEGKKSITIYKSNGKPKSVIVSSKNVREAIGDLSEAWHNPASGSILLSAWTGSGKDVLQDILAYALSVNNIRTIPLSAPHLGSSNEPLDLLYKELEKLKLFAPKPSSTDEYELNQVPLLFLDEVHHDSAQKLREQLLRVLEAKEMSSAGKQIDFKKARYLFAASAPPEKLRVRKPPDFWTRIEYTIVMRHPLLLTTRAEIKETLQQFFCVFWQQAADDWRDKTSDEQTIGIINYLCARTGDDRLKDLCPEPVDDRILGELSNVFAEALGTPLIPTVSIRLLRAIINRLFSRAIYFIRTEKLNEEKKLSELKSKMDEWIIDIFNNIVPEIKPEGVF
ncbi:MAG TPA: hypothetical protein VGX92_13885 [Pyrinomonadaceae bacterium]|jgi:hypothetical protein|nr:hypothetical protein [Pyrinomonadaceae bacterium]